MILVLFGQPCSGKSTIADEMKGMFMNIDGDPSMYHTSEKKSVTKKFIKQ